jgi:hypothetical protein
MAGVAALALVRWAAQEDVEALDGAEVQVKGVR